MAAMGFAVMLNLRPIMAKRLLSVAKVPYVGM